MDEYERKLRFVEHILTLGSLLAVFLGFTLPSESSLTPTPSGNSTATTQTLAQQINSLHFEIVITFGVLFIVFALLTYTLLLYRDRVVRFHNFAKSMYVVSSYLMATAFSSLVVIGLVSGIIIKFSNVWIADATIAAMIGFLIVLILFLGNLLNLREPNPPPLQPPTPTTPQQPTQAASTAASDASVVAELPPDADIEQLISQIDELTKKTTDKIGEVEKDRSPAVNDSIKALELHGRILYLTMKRQVASIDEVKKSSKNLERLSVSLITITLLLILATLLLPFFELIRTQAFPWYFLTLAIVFGLIYFVYRRIPQIVDVLTRQPETK